MPVLGDAPKHHLPQQRNTLQFLLPKKSAGISYFYRDLTSCTRAFHLADQRKAKRILGLSDSVPIHIGQCPEPASFGRKVAHAGHMMAPRDFGELMWYLVSTP